MAALSPKDIARAAELNRILNHAAYAYYALDNPELTDAEFDRLLIELQQLEAAYPELVTEDSYTQRVGGYVSEQFEPVQHAARMYSMESHASSSSKFMASSMEYMRAACWTG